MTYDNFSTTFAKSRQSMHWPEIEYFIDTCKPGLEPGHELKILDVGCGSGRLIPYLEKAYSKFNYLGTDSSSGMIIEAKKENPNYDFQVLDMTDLDKVSTKFDKVFFIASFHHLDTIESRLNTLNKLKGILNHDGMVYMTNWNLLSERNFKRYENAYIGNGDFNIKIGNYSRYYHSFGTDELNDLFIRSGFDIIENRIFDGDNNLISILQKG